MTREEFITHVERSRKALRRFLAALCCGDLQLADDFAQDAYIKAYLSLETLKDVAKFKAWMMRIAYTTFLNHKRTERPTVGYDDMPDRESHQPGADSSFAYQDLYAALDSLPPKERTSVLLYYMEGYAVKEVSEITGASPEAVRQHLSRGRARLKNILSKS